MRADYGAPDIDTSLAQRLAANAQQSFVAFQSVRALNSGAGALTTGTRASKPASAALNDFYFETDVGWLDYWSGTSWKYIAGMGYGTNAVRAAIAVTANDNGATYITNDQNKIWQVVAGVWVDRFVTLDLTTSLKIAGVKVIGAQGAAVVNVASADATDLATVITLANETKAQLNALLARVRAHGLIA